MPVCDPFRQNFRQSLIQDFRNQFDVLSGNHWFVGIGRTTEWVDSTGATNDNVPPKNVDSVGSDIDFWRSAIALKRIGTEDVSIVVPRYDWTAGSIYDAYRHDVDLFDDANPSKFYVLVDEERVYKCIDNNYSAASSVAPTHTDSQIRTLSDGYRWKYLYSISESKRKFLTNSTTTAQGFMPVEYVERINENDDRTLQWDVQNAAIAGSIDFVAVDENLRDYVISDRALFYSTANQVISATAAGSSSILIGGSSIVPQNDYYNGMVLRIEAGNGAGQQRVISDYTYNPNGTALVSLDNPLNYGVTGGTGSDASYYSILPNVVISGNGSAQVNTLNTYSTNAEVSVSFLNEDVVGYTGQKYIDAFEIINAGQDYSYATVTVATGLTFVSGIESDMSLLAEAIISPKGGHGSNPVKELGASSIMIVTEFNQDEDGELSVDNDYRQFALIKNPTLIDPQVRLRLSQAGLTASFAVGTTITQGFTGFDGTTGYDLAQGTVVSWRNGTLGTTGTSELVLSGVSDTFAYNGLIDGSFRIMDVSTRTVAGDDGRVLRRLKLVPSGASSFNGSGTDFTVGYLGMAVGNTADSIPASLASGRIYSWEPEAGTNNFGNLYLENATKPFTSGEYVTQLNNSYSSSFAPIGKIIEIDETFEPFQTIYSQITEMTVAYDGIEVFDENSFDLDSIVVGYDSGDEACRGYVVGWSAATGGTSGTLKVSEFEAGFTAGLNVLYTYSSLTGGTITEVVSSPTITQWSGEIVHTQNIRPIQRDLEQKEEIKFIVQF